MRSDGDGRKLGIFPTLLVVPDELEGAGSRLINNDTRCLIIVDTFRRPVDVNASRWDCTLEPMGDGRLAVRLGFRMVKGLANAAGAGIVVARADWPYGRVEDLWRRAGVPVVALRQLAAADAFAGLGLRRREAAWAIRALRDEALPLFAAAGAEREVVEPEVALRPLCAGGEVVEDYTMTGLSLRTHPLSFLRRDLRSQGIIPCADLARTRGGCSVTVSGLVLVRQRPGSANGVLFITLEDETGIANVIVWKKFFEQQRRVVLGASMMAVRGCVQVEGEVIHLIADQLVDQTDLLRSVGGRGEPMLPRPRQAEEVGIVAAGRLMPQAKEMYDPDLRLASGIKPQTRDFR